MKTQILKKVGDIDSKLLEGITILSDTIPNGYDIYVNIEHIWNETLDDDKFIKRFSLDLLHEEMHRLICGILSDYKDYIPSFYNEEKIVRKITCERMILREDIAYLKEDNSNYRTIIKQLFSDLEELNNRLKNDKEAIV